MSCLLVVNGTEQIKSWLDLEFWLVRFHDRADNSDINVLRTHVVCGGDHGNINISRNVQQQS